MRCSVVSGDIFAKHDLKGHAESRVRHGQVLSGVPAGVKWIDPVPASLSDLERVHTSRHIRLIQEFSRGHHFIDLNTYLTPDSFEVALSAAGSAILAIERALDGEACFALVRPPGHHAERDCAGGFCLFNNAAVGVAKALDLDSVDRVAVVDWDLHHGNGTQNIFYNDDRVLYCSVHERNSFPRTGWSDEIGTGCGKGHTLNAPLRSGSTIADYKLVFEEAFIPAIERFRPDLIVVSAGQDPLADDILGQMRLEPVDFEVLTGLLRESSDRPLALVLEGGYGPSHGNAISHIFRGLSGRNPREREMPDPYRSTERVSDLLKKVRFA